MTDEDTNLVSLAEKAPWRLIDLDDMMEGLINMGYIGVFVERADPRRPGMWRARTMARTEEELQRVTMIAPTIREAVFRVGQRVGRHFAPDPTGAVKETHQGDDAPTSDEIIDHLVGRCVDLENELSERSALRFQMSRELEALRPKGGLRNAVMALFREMRPKAWARRNWNT